MINAGADDAYGDVPADTAEYTADTLGGYTADSGGHNFGAWASHYKGQVRDVSNGIEGLAQLHSTHDEMWHRICAIAERGAKEAMQEFQKSILDFKTSMTRFKTTHEDMMAHKDYVAKNKTEMTIRLQRWLTARKAHAAAHTRYVNFLYHLGLDYNDQNPAAQYWRTYAHGVTGRAGDGASGKAAKSRVDRYGNPTEGLDGSEIGGWSPVRGPDVHIGKHSHKAFIEKLESVAVNQGNTTWGNKQFWKFSNVSKTPFYGEATSVGAPVDAQTGEKLPSLSAHAKLEGNPLGLVAR